MKSSDFSLWSLSFILLQLLRESEGNKMTGEETKIYDVNSQIQGTGVMIFPSELRLSPAIS